MSPSGCRNTTVHTVREGAFVFVTESGAIGLEVDGRLAIKRIEDWVGLAWNDMPAAKPFPRNDYSGDPIHGPTGGELVCRCGCGREYDPPKYIYGDYQFDTGLESNPNEGVKK